MSSNLFHHAFDSRVKAQTLGSQPSGFGPKHLTEAPAEETAKPKACEELKDTNYVVNHAASADVNPRIVIPAHNGKKEDLANLKEVSDEVLAKLYKNQG